MKTTPLTAAIKRLRSYRANADKGIGLYFSFHADLKLVLRAVKLLNEAEHTDDRDAEPVFEVRPACSWHLARKGLVHCLGVALAEEDSELDNTG